jgi:hypothetical protein
MSCLLIPRPFDQATLTQAVVSALQQHFQENLSAWLETVYGLVKTGVVIKMTPKGIEQRFRYPQIYLNDAGKSHLDIRPDSQVKSFCFFEQNSDVRYEAYDQATHYGWLTYDLGIVFWLNLPKIDNRIYDFTQELLQDVLNVGLWRSPLQYQVENVTADSRPESVFEKYSLDPAEKQFLMYPYSGFRLDVEIKQEYNPACYTPFAVQGDPTACPPNPEDHYVNPDYVADDFVP